MVPGRFVSLQSWPLSPSGKLDRAALPKPDKNLPAAKTPAVPNLIAKTESQKLLINFWQDLLGHAEFGLDDNFFDLGGHSLHLGKLQARLQRQGFGDVELVELFQYPTIRSLGARLQGSAAEDSPSNTAARADAPKRDALSSQRSRRRNARNRK
jgi:aryl carrier-like protein